MPNNNYLSYFLGQVPEEEQEKRKDQLKGTAFTERVNALMSGEAEPDPFFNSELLEIDQSGQVISHKSTGLVKPIEKPPQQPPQESNKNVINPFAKDQMNVDDQKNMGNAFDPEVGALKIDKVAGNIAPSIDEDDIPEFRPMELEEEPTDLENFINRVARGIPELSNDLMKNLNTTFQMLNHLAFNELGMKRYDVEGNEIVNENFLSQAQQVNEAVDKNFMPLLDAYLPTKDDDAFYSALGSGIGSGLFFIAGSMGGSGLVGSGSKLATKVIPSLLGAGTMSEQMFEDAMRSGATEEEAIINYLSGGGLGATEGMLGIGNLMSKVGKRIGKNIVKDILTGAGEEWFQETFQTLGQNFTVKETYDLSRDLMDGVGRSGAVALITGGLFSGGVSAVNRLSSNEKLSEDDRLLLEQARANFNEISKTYHAQMFESEQGKEVGETDHEQYIREITEVKKGDPDNYWTVDIPTESDMDNATVINVEGGSGIVTKDGDIKGLYKKKGSKEKGVAKKFMKKAVDNGGITADNYDVYLTKLYEDAGFRVVSRTPFNPEYAPDDWTPSKGTPDIVAMVYDPDNKLIFEEQTFSTYDEAINYRDRVADQISDRPNLDQKIREEQSNIPHQYTIPIFYYSDTQNRGFINDPSPKTIFYTDPRQIKRGNAGVQDSRIFMGVADARKVYNLQKNVKRYGFDGDKFSVDQAVKEAKADGWEGVRYPSTAGETVKMFKPVYIERQGGAPSLGEIVSGRWDKSVADAKKRLNSGFYGDKLMDASTIPVMGTRFVADIGMIMADKLIKTKTKFGTPQEFAERLIDEFGEAYPIVRRFARQIYEYAKSIRDQMKQNPLQPDQLESIKTTVHKNLMEGKTGEYIPTGKGVIILGGDILDFEGGRRKAVGLGFPKDQALRSLRDKAVVKHYTSGGAPMVNIALKNGKGSITAIERPDGTIQIKGSGVDKGLQGKGFGADLYDAMIDYAISKGYTEIESDNSLSEDSYNQYKRLADKFSFEVVESEGVIKEERNKRTYYRVRGDSGIFKVKLPDQQPNRRGRSHPIWATGKIVAKQISDNATLHGNDTIVFMAYPNAWNAMKPNYLFQQALNNKVKNELGEAPELPTIEEWKGNKKSREKYSEQIAESLKKIKEGKTQEEQSVWSQDKLAYEFGVKNGENLVGKIVGTAKFKQVNFGKDRIDPHKVYDAEIEGYNYQELNEPIDFNFVKEETEGTDVAVQGKIKDMQGKARERARRNNMWRNLQQRGLSISEGQSKLVDALILAGEGDNNLLNQWLQDNDNTAGEIVDNDKYNEWLNNPQRQKEIELLRSQANKSLEEFLKPADQVGKENRDSQGRLPSHPDYEGGTYLASFFDQRTWNSMVAVGKAIGRGAKGFAKWSQEMVKQLGDWIRPALRSLYKAVNQIPNIFKQATNKELNYRQTEENLTDPTENKTENEEKRIMGRVPSVTKGYNMGREHPLLSGMVDQMLEAMRTEFDVRRRGTISNEDLIAEAKRRAESLTDDDVWNLKQGDIKNAEDTLALRIYVADKSLRVIDEMKKLTKQSDAFTIKEMSNELANAMRMYEAVRSIGTEAGRVVQSFNIPLVDQMMDGMKHAMEIINSLDPDNKHGGKEVQEALEDITGLKTETKEQKQSVMEWVRYIFLNWILQNPLTDTANIFGNISNLGFHVTANIGNLGGMKTLLTGIRKGSKEGIINAKKILHGEEEAISKFTENSPIQLPSDKKRSWKNYFRLLVPTTRLGIEDSFFRALGRNIEMERMSYKVGKDMGISPDLVAQQVSEIINDPKLEKYTRSEFKEMADYLQKIEDELVFQNELGQIGKGFQKISKVAFPIIPFVTTPANIVKFGISATPFGLLKLAGKKSLSSEEKNQIIRRALAGSVFMSGLAGLVAQGLVQITGGGSDDTYDRDLMEKLGYKPYHLYVKTPFGTFGGSYMNVNPMNTALAVVGDLFDKYRFNKFNDNPAEDLAWYNKVAQDLSTALLAVGSSVTDQSYLSGVRDLMDALAGRNPDWFMRTLTGYSRMGGISGWQRIAGTEDRGRYNTKGRAEEQIQKNSPLLSNEGLVESVSAFGDQRQSQYERFPLPISQTKEGTAYNWLMDNELRLKIPSKTTKIGNRELTRKEYELYSKGVGKIMDAFVNKLYEQQNDPELDPDKKLDLEKLQEKIDKAYDTAKKAVMEKIKKLIYEKYQLEGNK